MILLNKKTTMFSLHFELKQSRSKQIHVFDVTKVKVYFWIHISPFWFLILNGMMLTHRDHIYIIQSPEMSLAMRLCKMKSNVFFLWPMMLFVKREPAISLVKVLKSWNSFLLIFPLNSTNFKYTTGGLTAHLKTRK